MMTSTVDGTIRHPQPVSCWVVFDSRLADSGSLDALRAAVARQTVLSPVWRSTSAHETAAQVAAAAISAQADRVIVIGDEVTIRSVASALANTGVALGIVPVGSGW
jgi:diacylglycerol kinase family enzyme